MCRRYRSLSRANVCPAVDANLNKAREAPHGRIRGLAGSVGPELNESFSEGYSVRPPFRQPGHRIRQRWGDGLRRQLGGPQASGRGGAVLSEA